MKPRKLRQTLKYTTNKLVPQNGWKLAATFRIFLFTTRTTIPFAFEIESFTCISQHTNSGKLQRMVSHLCLYSRLLELT